MDRILGFAALILLLPMLFIGRFGGGVSIESVVRAVWPDASRFEDAGGGIAAVYGSAAGGESLLGYAASAEAQGYSGPVRIAVAVDTAAVIKSVHVVDNRETFSFMRRVLNSGLPDALSGRRADDGMADGAHAVTGATYSSDAVVTAARRAAAAVAEQRFGMHVPPETPPGIVFGFREALLIFLFAAGYGAASGRLPQVRRIRWVMMTAGLVFFGFVYNSPLTIAKVNAFLLGYLPDWRTGLFWYILIGGILVITLKDGKNPYCKWICPFGAAQECVGLIGGARSRTPVNLRQPLIWIQRAAVFMAVAAALLFANPGLTSYEIFGVLFELNGRTVSFALLGLVLVASLYVKRPWCVFLCPLRPVTDYLNMLHCTGKDIWRKRVKKRP